jgi:hypothetical protein
MLRGIYTLPSAAQNGRYPSPVTQAPKASAWPFEASSRPEFSAESRPDSLRGDKSGQWARWYQTATPCTERLYGKYLAIAQEAVAAVLDDARGWRLAEMRERRGMTQEQVAIGWAAEPRSTLPPGPGPPGEDATRTRGEPAITSGDRQSGVGTAPFRNVSKKITDISLCCDQLLWIIVQV